MSLRSRKVLITREGTEQPAPPLTNEELLGLLLVEMRTMNLHLAKITDEVVQDSDLEV